MRSRYLHENVVDWNVHELDSETDETHDRKTGQCRQDHFLVLFLGGFGAADHEAQTRFE